MPLMSRKGIKLVATLPRKKDKKGWSFEEVGEFYRSKTWRRLRANILNNEPLCRECLKNNIATTANIVDHVIPIRLGGDPYEIQNLQPLCKKCHEVKTNQERKLKARQEKQ